MIRSTELIDKLVADLHFHHYLFVNEGDDVFSDHSEHISRIENMLASLGLDEVLNPHTDFFHGGNVVTQRGIDHIYDYIDDVYIDYFFRTYHFHSIIVPKGFCDEQVTPIGLTHPDETSEVVLDLSNIYDRCTFVGLVLRLFGQPDSKLRELYQNNSFIKGFRLAYRKSCYVIENEYPYGDELQLYIEKHYGERSKFKPALRAEEVVSYNQFYKKYKYRFDYQCLTEYWANNYYRKIDDYILIKDQHLFGEYSIEDMLILYSLLINQLVLREKSLITFLSPHLDVHRDGSIFNEFRRFENNHNDYKEIEPFIHSKDLYLRFTSRERSRAFKFEIIDNLFESIQLFQQLPIKSLIYNNPIQLPYLYNSLNLY